MRIVTNNPLIRDKYGGLDLFFLPSIKETLILARDMVHTGSKLLSHSIVGGIKQSEQPYRTLILEEQAGEPDIASLLLIEKAIEMNINSLENPDYLGIIGNNVDHDYAKVDFAIMSMAIEKAIK